MLVDVFTRRRAVRRGDQSGRTAAALRHGPVRPAGRAPLNDQFPPELSGRRRGRPETVGLYRVRVAMTSLAKEELGHLIARMRQEHVVELAEPSE